MFGEKIAKQSNNGSDVSYVSEIGDKPPDAELGAVNPAIRLAVVMRAVGVRVVTVVGVVLGLVVASATVATAILSPGNTSKNKVIYTYFCNT